MSRYTSEVRYICESLTNLDSQPVAAVIAAAVPLIFDFSFPIFEESYRVELEKKILRHFYTREIGLETYPLWKLKLETRLCEFMPYANKLYSMLAEEFNPLITEDYTRTFSGNVISSGGREIKNTSNTSGNNTSNTTGKHLDTPQGSIQILTDGNYLTYADQNNSNSNYSDTNTTTGNESNNNNTNTGSTETIKGKVGGGSYGSIMKEYTEALLNVDGMVFDYLEPLFMGLW